MKHGTHVCITHVRHTCKSCTHDPWMMHTRHMDDMDEWNMAHIDESMARMRMMHTCHVSCVTCVKSFTLQHTSTRCNNTATIQSSVLSTAVYTNLPLLYSRCTTLQHTTPHCNTLHQTATHCSTLQHTVIHCNNTKQYSIDCFIHELVHSQYHAHT